ncbi:MAG: cytochrome c-type biogenesis protein [Xanthobacteraceae bacterium]|jgi:cytochrome c-type biogenesis protein CcmH
MSFRPSLLLAVLLALAAAPVLAVQPDEMLADRGLETRARGLSRELRCMVCQNQSIDDSDAPLARDLRILVRERLKAGDSDGQVLEFLTARYGDFVLLKPRFAWHTAVLWIGPPALLGAGAIALVLVARRRRGAIAGAEGASLTAAEQARLAELTGARD